MIELKGIQCLLKVGFNSCAVGYLKCNSQIVFFIWAPGELGKWKLHFPECISCSLERTKQYDVEHLLESVSACIIELF